MKMSTKKRQPSIYPISTPDNQQSRSDTRYSAHPVLFIVDPFLGFPYWLVRNGQNGTEIKSLQLGKSLQAESFIIPGPFAVNVLGSNENIAPFPTWRTVSGNNAHGCILVIVSLPSSPNRYSICSQPPCAGANPYN